MMKDIVYKFMSKDDASNFTEWSLDRLCNHILDTQHVKAMEQLPKIVAYTSKIADVHGGNHPELIEIATIMSAVAHDFEQHLQVEAEILFPAIKEAAQLPTEKTKAIILKEITKMLDEHESFVSRVDSISKLTAAYELPSDACNTYAVAFQLLKQFEQDLHVHVHLENNILFPKSLKIA